MNIFDPSKSLIENLSLLSAPILAILGFAAIIQLRLTKKAIVISSKRQAAELATQQIEVYTNKIIPLQDELSKFDEEKKFVRVPIENLKDFTSEEIAKFIGEADINKVVEYNYENPDLIVKNLNLLDTFSIYFIKGIADEEIGYSGCGYSFCKSVEQYAIDISILRDEENKDIFVNIPQLYEIWNARLKAEKISLQLLKNKADLKKIKIKKVDIIGTK